MNAVIVVIPTYNESENLPRLIPQVLAQDPSIEVLVVDDNSPDGTGKLAEELAERTGRVHVLHRPNKDGLGPAYRAGLRRALELHPRAVIQMDADFSHPPELLPAMIAELDRSDVVIGSRYINGVSVVNWPIERILISYFGNLYARRVTGLRVVDATSGFRGMRREALERVGFERGRSSGYAFQIELDYRFQCQGATITELPFIFPDRTRGSSKLDLSVAIEAVWLVWWLRFSAALGRL
jgi:dolichol-phosphate mannosyltransferase